MYNTLKKYRFLFLVLLGAAIQAVTLYITFQIVPRGEGWFAGLAQIYWYLWVGQWVGYIIQLFIARKITGKFTTSFKICVATIIILYSGFFIKDKIRQIKEEAEIKREKLFELDESAQKKAMSNVPSTLKIGEIKYELSCPSSFVIPEGYGKFFDNKYEILTLDIPVTFEKKGEYPIRLFYGSDLSESKVFEKNKTINVLESGNYVIKWVIHSSEMWGYFVKSEKSHIKTEFSYSYSNNDIYPPNVLDPDNQFNYEKQTKLLPSQAFEILGIANSISKVFPEHFECQQTPSMITLLKQ